MINKPAGLVVHPGVGNRKGTLANGLVYYFNSLSEINGITRPGIIHRLDSETSGVMLIAKTNQAHINIAKQFHDRTIKKEYIALTWGQWPSEKGTINKAIKRKHNDPTIFSVKDGGKASITQYQLIKQFNHLAQVKFFPKTGRTHQIRVHSSWMGNPIFGDNKYGGGIAKTKGYIPELKQYYIQAMKNFNRHALHAEKLGFKHPKTGDFVFFQSSLPKEYITLMESIENLND